MQFRHEESHMLAHQLIPVTLIVLMCCCDWLSFEVPQESVLGHSYSLGFFHTDTRLNSMVPIIGFHLMLRNYDA